MNDNKLILFKDFMNESNDNANDSDKNRDKVLNQMSKFIQKRFKDEDRIVFTYWMGVILGFENFLIISKIELSEYDKDIVHVYIIIDSEEGNKYFDGDGFHTIAELYKEHNMSKYTFNDFTYTSNIDKVKKYLDIKDIKLKSNQIDEFKHIVETFKEKIK